ncbi:lipoprotein-releasing ABC transporter permease subunit [Algihabitans albus]|uniref:lipoprotein-releasing ABC transporter permease subunit n=1 Tax=Algihabitans albus TaxID=2164067 RepID=UPI000E5CEFDA|nr:lipoprotein-releasing ABC transporter permease subunit [Algihabitans albus]
MLFGAVERLMALRYLRSRRQEGFISVIAVFSLLGIALGVATLIIVMAVMNGFRVELLDRILGVNGHLTLHSTGDQSITDYPSLAERLRQLPHVQAVTPQVQGQVMVMSDGRANGALVRGVSGEALADRPKMIGDLRQTSLEEFAEGEGVLIGIGMSRSLGLNKGDRITLVSPQMSRTAVGSIPRMKAYPILGFFEVGMHEYDNSFIYMPLTQAQVFFRHPEGVNAIEIMVDNPDQVAGVRGALNEQVTQALRITDWQSANSSFFNAVQVERNVMFLILSLIILVAAFNILSGQYMLVKGKGRDIAILRTMGAPRGLILRVFFMSGAAIGLFGTLAGLGLGLLFIENIQTLQGWVERLSGTQVFNPQVYFLTRLPAVVDWNEVWQVIAMALGISFLAPLLPAWQAARLDPVEALRYE